MISASQNHRARVALLLARSFNRGIWNYDLSEWKAIDSDEQKFVFEGPKGQLLHVSSNARMAWHPAEA